MITKNIEINIYSFNIREVESIFGINCIKDGLVCFYINSQVLLIHTFDGAPVIWYDESTK